MSCQFVKCLQVVYFVLSRLRDLSITPFLLVTTLYPIYKIPKMLLSVANSGSAFASHWLFHLTDRCKYLLTIRLWMVNSLCTEARHFKTRRDLSFFLNNKFTGSCKIRTWTNHMTSMCVQTFAFLMMCCSMYCNPKVKGSAICGLIEENFFH